MAADEPPLAELASGEGSATVGSSPSSEALSRLLSEFNLSEFLALANRVIDEGDLSSMEIIADLKHRWIERFGDSHSRLSMDTCPKIPCLPTSEQMTAYLEPPPAVSHFSRSLTCTSTTVDYGCPSVRVESCGCNPCAAFRLHGIGKFPTRSGFCSHLPYLMRHLPYKIVHLPKRVECQPQSSIENQPQYSMFSMDRTTPQDPALLWPSIHGVPPSLHGDKPSKRVECQPQYSMFSMDRSTPKIQHCCGLPFMACHLPCTVISLPNVWSVSRNLPLRVSHNIPCLAWIELPPKIQHCCGLPFMACHLPCTVISLPNVWIISRNLPYLAWLHI
ncbi:hypothetical protein Salat_2882500 [Sesamum alatum]|uniref:Uncharacterized protein n=1 Tax=Sesamum alatum TaxID=300844 RepID=A0AAE1XI43_9LAMI|nr:hypothetical protein Salat_2882500 [Sesamum alatum]